MPRIDTDEEKQEIYIRVLCVMPGSFDFAHEISRMVTNEYCRLSIVDLSVNGTDTSMQAHLASGGVGLRWEGAVKNRSRKAEN